MTTEEERGWNAEQRAASQPKTRVVLKQSTTFYRVVGLRPECANQRFQRNNTGAGKRPFLMALSPIWHVPILSLLHVVRRACVNSLS
ncbi:UNVERIFIED_ORG: hypothetical protein BCL66_11183 [Martelella mediterranea]